MKQHLLVLQRVKSLSLILSTLFQLLMDSIKILRLGTSLSVLRISTAPLPCTSPLTVPLVGGPLLVFGLASLILLEAMGRMLSPLLQ